MIGESDGVRIIVGWKLSKDLHSVNSSAGLTETLFTADLLGVKEIVPQSVTRERARYRRAHSSDHSMFYHRAMNKAIKSVDAKCDSQSVPTDPLVGI